MGLEVIGKGDPEKSPLQITLRKMMKQEAGALGTTVGSGSESIQSTASALRWVSGGGCK